MKRMLMLLLVFSLFSIALVACNSDNNATPTPAIVEPAVDTPMAEPAVDTPTPAEMTTPTVEGGEVMTDTMAMTATPAMTDTNPITDTMDMTDTEVITP